MLINYHDIRWSDLAQVPEATLLPLQLPLPGSALFDTVHGRSGDLLVIQVRSGKHEKKARQETLRSLGLKGVRSASLRSSGDGATRGYIRAVRDLVGVIELDGVKWKESSTLDRASDLQYESLDYGTNTRPGGLVRDSLGNYFVFESDRNGVLLNWSTSLSLLECYENLVEATERQILPASMSGLSKERPEGENLSILAVKGSAQPGVSAGTTSDRHDAATDPIDFIELPTDEALTVMRAQGSAIAVARLAFRGMDLTWQQPYARFIDSDRETAEVGLYSRDLSFPVARRLARLTGPEGFLDQATVEVLVRRSGNLKRFKL